MDWHHPRPELANLYLNTLFDIGAVSALALHAKRRMGKTEFLQLDLMPAASERGVIPVYANLWEARPNPARAISQAILEQMKGKSL